MGQKVLFVDDDKDWREIVAASFEMAGYEIITVADASEGMIRAEEEQLRLIILDVNLAGENGLVLLRFMKRNYPDVPVLIFTGMDHDDAAVRGMLAEGAAEYVPKTTVEQLLVTAGGYLKLPE